MSEIKIQEHDAETNVINIRNATAAEIKEFEKMDKLVQSQREAAEQAFLDLQALKESAKAKLIAGQPLTEAEANTLVI